MAEVTYTADMLEAEGSAKSRFSKLDADRSSVLERARECSQLTIPSVVVEDGHSENDDLDTPYQAVGSRLVHNLANKIVLALFPPNTSFMRLLPDPEVVELVKAQDPEGEKELDKQLVIIEQETMKQTEREALRAPLFEGAKSLIIGGNGLLRKIPTGLKFYRMANYVVLRDFSGNPLEIIAKEKVTKDTLPEDIRDQLENSTDQSENVDVLVYTRAVKKNGVWLEYQTVEEVIVEGSEITYNDENEFPFIPLRWTNINGENYGRGLVEQYIGDFRSLEALYQLVLEASAVMARVIFGKRPGSTTDVRDLNNAENGECIVGDLEQDISVLQVGKNADLQVVLNTITDITRRLEQAFLVASSAARDSERTTATEIRYMAADLEQSLGGVYSLLSLELQRPLGHLLLAQSKVDIASLGIDLVVVTGIEALGRNAELDKLRQFNALLQEIGAPDVVLSRIKVDNYIDMLGNALSLDTTDLIKSDEEVAQEQQAAQQQALLQQGAGNLVNGATQAVTQPQQ